MDNFNRYDRYTKDGKVSFIPFVKIPEKLSDRYVKYDSRKHRMDKLSYEFYGSPNYGWLILMANPSIASLEFNIPDETIIRIPYPLSETIQSYNDELDKYETIN